MAHPQYNQYQQNMHNMPPIQTQNQMQNQRAFSPPNYQQSPGAMSPTAGGIPPAKRQRLSPQPASPYNSPFSAGPYVTSPYATSPPGSQYLALPHSPAASQPTTPSFNQPQPYHHLQNMDSRPPPQGSMPPPKVPYSKTQDNAELEKANPRDMDVNNISDVMTGAGVDLRAEEDALLSNIGSRNYGTSFNSQATGSTISPQGSFNQWANQAGHGAFQGTGPLSQPTTKESQEDEFLQKHRKAARILNETASQPLTDPFLFAGALRQRIAKRAYEHGIGVNLEGLFDKIPEQVPQNVTRTTMTGSNGESIVGLQASSLLNQNAPLVEILSLLSLAAEERVRTVVEDSFALSQGRQTTSDGIVPPSLADIAAVEGKTVTTTVIPANISKTAWEAAPDSAISPMTVTAQKQPPNAARLPTPPSEAPPTPQSTIQFTTNHVMNGLKRKITEDEQYEQDRINKRKKRQQGSSATPADTPTIAPLPIPEKMTKKERDRINKAGQTEEVLHRKTNETTNLALFGKKKSKYSWMSAGGGPSSGASTPRLNTAVGGGSGTATPMRPQTDGSLKANRHLWLGGGLEGAQGQKVQIRDLVHVLEHDGRERKTLVSILSRLRSSIKDDQPVEDRPKAVAPAR